MQVKKYKQVNIEQNTLFNFLVIFLHTYIENIVVYAKIINLRCLSNSSGKEGLIAGAVIKVRRGLGAFVCCVNREINIVHNNDRKICNLTGGV